MYYDAELRLLRDTFYKCRIQTHLLELATPLAQYAEYEIFPFTAGQLDLSLPLDQYLPGIETGIVYRLCDSFDCRYLYLLLPEFPRPTVLAIGPYLPDSITDSQILEQAEAVGVSPALLPELVRCYSNVPLLSETSHLFLLLESFCERLWGPGNFTTEDLGQYRPTTPLPAKAEAQAAQTEQWNIQVLEQRYQYENQLLDAVATGQTHKVRQLFANLSTFFFERRTPDTLRNTKNYCIVMNTLLRKAAERGGVHPVYLDKLSSAYAVRIEQTASVDRIAPLMTEMFHGYCQLVRDHATRHYSPAVQKAVLFIDANLSEDLRLHTLAQKVSVSAGYLSGLFKKETGQNLTDYVNRRRVAYAAQLLTDTRLQIQTIAQHCGIMDVQYFSKVFKRITGLTPKEYRSTRK